MGTSTGIWIRNLSDKMVQKRVTFTVLQTAGREILMEVSLTVIFCEVYLHEIGILSIKGSLKNK